MARTLATVQAIIAEQPMAAKAKLPETRIQDIPVMLDYMIVRIANNYIGSWLANDAKLMNKHALPINVIEQIDNFRPTVTQWTQEIIDGEWPVTIDHVDFNISNAAVQDNGKVLIYDWEEAVLGSPFFSIERLLDDADSFEDHPEGIPQDQGPFRLTANQMAIRNAYIDAIPWHTRSQRGRAFDLAMCLAPIKAVYEHVPKFKEAWGLEEGHPGYAAHCIGRALHRWKALDS
jgi:hypothetical protein